MKMQSQTNAAECGGGTRVAIYARYSTDEQSTHSIDAQLLSCRRFLAKLNLGEIEESVISEPAISGELIDRPGINHLKQLIETKACELIVSEDVSRLYRHSTEAMHLLEMAKDAGIRVLTVHDHLDTDKPDWRTAAQLKSMKGEQDNVQTSERIRRAMDELFENGFAVKMCKPGYCRIPSQPSTDREPEKGPFRDVRDDAWTSTIVKAFEMAAGKEPLWRIADFLTASGLPLSRRVKVGRWTEASTRTFIRDSIYKGVETYRKQHNVRQYRKGKSIQVVTQPEKILMREVPQLAHVSESLWQEANDGIVRRRTHSNYPAGASKYYTRIPRDSRGPLSQHFRCGACNALMYRDGAAYRCSDSKRRATLKRQNSSPCWNRCGAQPDVVHAKIGSAIVDAILKSEDRLDLIVQFVSRFAVDGDGSTRNRLEELRRSEMDLERRCSQLCKSLEIAQDLNRVSGVLREREGELSRTRGEIARLEAMQAQKLPLPTVDDVRREIDLLKPKLISQMDREAGPILRKLTSPIIAVPHKLFDVDRFVIRASFTLNLVSLVPFVWQQILSGNSTWTEQGIDATVLSIPMNVDLFEMSARVRYAQVAGELFQSGLSLSQLGHQLAIREWTAEEAVRTWKRMQALGLNDPYIMLSAKPPISRRWRRADDPEDIDASNHGGQSIGAV